ncbi:MAG: signal recognition particle protein [Betaproteobacteria bacterium]|jgi:signal recognition particle subunit SRP54|nr:MAG: signal recognition particle protein [Betaproteobacteria bacterium]
MLETLTGRFSTIVKTVRGQARLTDANVKETLREVRVALLEADVALPVVRDFIERVREKAIGEEVLGSLTPGQAFVGVVQRELTTLMGQHNNALDVAVRPPAVILMAGLQGSGKTTTSAKLARLLAAQKKKVLLVSCDVYRPAAMEQLNTLARQLQVDNFPAETLDKPKSIALAALDHAKRHFHDVVIVDTAGRLAVDEEMMREIRELHEALVPSETLFVVDAMQGQDAVNVAKAFGDALPLTGVILTKMDGDARGGAALSVRQVTGKPIKFVGTGEKLDGLEPFFPDRVAARILGMGDVLSLVDEARRSVDAAEAQKLARKVKSGKGFDLEDFRSQMLQMRKMGGVGAIIDRLPAQFAQAAQGASMDEGVINRTIGIIDSMTQRERANPGIIKASRKRRIASGSGVRVQEVNRLLSQFAQMQKMMKMMGKGGLQKMMRGARGMFPGLG